MMAAVWGGLVGVLGLVLYGYLQFRLQEAFGPVVAVIGSTLAWTFAHAAVMSAPGGRSPNPRRRRCREVVAAGYEFPGGTVCAVTHACESASACSSTV